MLGEKLWSWVIIRKLGDQKIPKALTEGALRAYNVIFLQS